MGQCCGMSPGRLGGPTADDPPVAALRDADQADETRGGHLSLRPDHLELLVGPRRCSALRFQTRSSTCASSAAFNSSISSSTCRSRAFGLTGPLSAKPALPPSRNCCFQREIDCSLAFPPTSGLHDRHLTTDDREHEPELVRRPGATTRFPQQRYRGGCFPESRVSAA